VHAREQKEEQRIEVTSVCEKPDNAEGVYGKCSHNIAIYPGKKEFVVKTGEDVIMVNSPNQKLILSTLEYGCCGGPDTARFYADDGAYLGSLQGFELRQTANYENVITRTFDMRNATENYLVVTAKGGKGTFEALAFETNKSFKKLPISFTAKDKEACQYWHLDEFVKYGDRDFITLKVKGAFCRQEAVKDQEFRCTKTTAEINCTPFLASQ